jgi:uncharacterized protein YqcC (DUF446 family)
MSGFVFKEVNFAMNDITTEWLQWIFFFQNTDVLEGNKMVST